MNTIPAQELKRRGISAVDEALKKGPVHVIKNNRPQYVVMTEEDYEKLLHGQSARTENLEGDIWDLILNRPWQGSRSKEDIDAQIREERAAWDDE